MSIPFFSCRQSYRLYQPQIDRFIDRITAEGVFSNGPLVRKLESALSAYTGARHVIGLSNGTDALILMLQTAGVGPGDEVLVPAFTFVASATSVAHVGATPVFVDIDPVTYSIDPRKMIERITPRTKAVMPVHLFCQLADTPAIDAVAADHRLLVLEDSAEGIGMRANGHHAGRFGRAGTLSFFPTKTLGGFGDGGAVLTDDDQFASTARLLRDQGRAVADGPALVCGHNARMDEVQAAVLLARLLHLDDEIAKRAELARFYNRRLAALAPRVRTPIVADRGAPSEAVFYVYVIETERRDELVRHLTANGIGTEVYYPRTLPQQPCFAYLGYRTGDFPVAEAACRSAVALPLYPDLSIAEADTVCRAIESFFPEN